METALNAHRFSRAEGRDSIMKSEGADASYNDGGVQLDWRASARIRLAGEYLKQREDVAGQIDNSSTLGVRLSFDVNERLSSFVECAIRFRAVN